MIKDIEIENFRCFEHTKIEGFERVNLIGGKNNSGKTALLEAILLNQSPQYQTIFLLRKLRQESQEFSKAYPEKAWDNFFYNNQSHEGSKIKSIIFNNRKHQKVTLKVRKAATLYPETSKINSNNHDNIDNKDVFEDETSLLYKDKIYSYLDIFINSNVWSSDDENYYFKIVYNEGGIKIGELRPTKQDQPTNDLFFVEYRSLFSRSEIKLISSKELQISTSNVSEYSKLELNQQTKKLLKILQSIDNSIESIKVLSIGEPNLYIQQKSKKLLPISLFGDAINRVTEIVLKIMNNNLRTILIDEIENGIHYTNHRDFWKALFELSQELNVQIFATTHSLEMIQAFRDIGLNYYADSGAYFELNRHYKTNKIIGIKRDLDILDYSIEHGKGVRGE